MRNLRYKITEFIARYSIVIILVWFGLLISYIFLSVNDLRNTQRNTIRNWTRHRNMQTISCLNLREYCECVVFGNGQTLIVKVSNDEPTRIFSVVNAINVE